MGDEQLLKEIAEHPKSAAIEALAEAMHSIEDDDGNGRHIDYYRSLAYATVEILPGLFYDEDATCDEPGCGVHPQPAYRAGQAATPDGARRWALPDEPGPEVTAVRDRDGRRWYREQRGWTYQNFAFPWVQLLRDLGPLTDATPAADGQDGDGRG